MKMENLYCTKNNNPIKITIMIDFLKTLLSIILMIICIPLALFCVTVLVIAKLLLLIPSTIGVYLSELSLLLVD